MGGEEGGRGEEIGLSSPNYFRGVERDGCKRDGKGGGEVLDVRGCFFIAQEAGLTV
jgi:hypothetical protein